MDRLARARALLGEHNLDALFISGAENRRYLSGFTGSAGWLLLDATHALLMSDGRYAVQAGLESPDWDFRLVVPPKLPVQHMLKTAVAELGVTRIGFEAADLAVAQYNDLHSTLGDGEILVPTVGLIEGLRERKEPGELALLERAVALTDAAFAQVRPLIRPAMRERELAWEIEKALHEAGADGMAFEVIVAAGLNSAKPHARPGDDQLGRGRPIILDFGALYQGYHGDMSRTIILGEADEQFTRIYQLVLDAQQHAAANVRAGMRGADADALARDRFAAAGLAEAFGHSLGHGVGLAIHEGPSLRMGVAATLPAQSVVSIEPGLYLPEWGGVRIEDLVLLTDTGVRTLTQSSKDPVIV